MFRYYHDPIAPPGVAYTEPKYWHHQHAIVSLNNDPLLFEAICYAHHDLGSPRRAEHHPAIKQLNYFWQHYTQTAVYDAGIPFIQVYVGDYTYAPLVPSIPRLDTHCLSNHYQQDVSVIMDNDFLVTYLASSEHAKYNAVTNEWLHYTVFKQPFLIEKNDKTKHESLLAWQTLQGLRHFHIHFPTQWATLMKKYGGKTHEIH